MKTILVTAFAATTLMTLFSYVVSAIFKRVYQETLLLEFVMANSRVKLGPKYRTFAAWAIHYSIGILFIVAFHNFFPLFSAKYLWQFGSVFGLVIGIIGITGWDIMFDIVGKPQRTDAAGYFIQLFIAHIVFAFTATFIYSF